MPSLTRIMMIAAVTALAVYVLNRPTVKAMGGGYI